MTTTTQTTWHREHRRNERSLALIQDEGNGNVAEINIIRADAEANARLIVLAPAMYDALMNAEWAMTRDAWDSKEGEQAAALSVIRIVLDAAGHQVR